LGGKFVKFGDNSAGGVNIQGVSHLYNVVRNFDITSGRYFTEAESNNGNDVCIIGSDVFTTYFPVSSQLVSKYKLTEKYEVIGIFKKEGESMIGNSLDNVIVIPVGSAAKIVRINSDRANSRIHVKASQAKSMTEVEND
jgi:putative ABC transport system permease protein